MYQTLAPVFFKVLHGIEKSNITRMREAEFEFSHVFSLLSKSLNIAWYFNNDRKIYRQQKSFFTKWSSYTHKHTNAT